MWFETPPGHHLLTSKRSATDLQPAPEPVSPLDYCSHSEESVCRSRIHLVLNLHARLLQRGLQQIGIAAERVNLCIDERHRRQRLEVRVDQVDTWVLVVRVAPQRVLGKPFPGTRR